MTPQNPTAPNTPASSTLVKPPRRWIVETLFRTGSLNLVGGAVGVGKTTLLLQLGEAVGLGRSFLGFGVEQAKVAYVTIDRGREETLETLDRLRVPREALTLFPVDELAIFPTLRDLIERLCPTFAVVVVEPLDYLLRSEEGRTGNPNDKMQVYKFLLDARRALASFDSLVIGSMHTTKSPAKGGYTIARERIAGSTAWTANTSTSVLVESANPADECDPRRRVTLMPRNSPNLALDMWADDETGRLVEVEIPDTYTKIWKEIQDAEPGTIWDTSWVKYHATFAGVNPKSIRRFLDRRIAEGHIADAGRGLWSKPHGRSLT